MNVLFNFIKGLFGSENPEAEGSIIGLARFEYSNAKVYDTKSVKKKKPTGEPTLSQMLRRADNI